MTTIVAKTTCLMVLAFAAIGCNSEPSIQGHVTFEGKSLEKGRISFVPEPGEGSPFACMVKNGSYHVKKCTVGPRTVVISASEIPEYTPGSGGTVFARELIPPDAVGNQQKVEIKPGLQTLNFDLTLSE